MENNDFYPEKPLLVESNSKNRLDITIFSMVLFVASMMWFLDTSIWFILSLLIVLLIHELGHFIFMKRFNYKSVKMLFIPLLGAVVNGKKEQYSQKESFLVVLAGPIPGVLLGMVCLYVGQVYKIPEVMTLALIFVFLNVLNLLPFEPLDGGQLLQLFIQKNSDIFQMSISLITSLGMIGIGLMLESWVLIIFGFLMGFRVRNMQKNYVIRKDMMNEGLNFRKNYTELSNKEYAQIRQFVIDNNSALRKYLEMSDGQNDEQLVAKEVQAILAPPMLLDTSWMTRLVLFLVWIGAIFAPIYFLFIEDFDLNWYYGSIPNWG